VGFVVYDRSRGSRLSERGENLASEINKIQEARHADAVEYSTPTGAPPATDTVGSSTQRTVLDPGA
jgi:hypothetical protein